MRLPELVQGIILTVNRRRIWRCYRQNAAGYGYLDGGHYLGRICAAGGAGLPAYMAIRGTEDKLAAAIERCWKDAKS